MESLARAAPRGAVFFDRDGVLNEDVGYAHRPDQIRWIDGAVEAIREVNARGWYAFVATNQSGVARGYYTEDDVLGLHAWMTRDLAAQGAYVDAFAYSPFHPAGTVERYRRQTQCRKPGPGMLLDLMARFPVDRQRAVMIGDQESDVSCAEAAGIKGLLFTGGSVWKTLGPVLDSLQVASLPLHGGQAVAVPMGRKERLRASASKSAPD